jgi:hypothetical protein
MVAHLDAIFPGLQGQAYQVQSPPTLGYNCIAWAAGDSQNWWWPDEDGQDTWPAGVARAETLEAFRDAFAALGYVACDREDLEPGFEKIALYATAQAVPKHATRQLANGRWTSKLGGLEDIEHELHDLSGAAYGTVVQVMKRPLPPAE